MIIARHQDFLKHYKKRVSQNPKLIKKFEERLNLFLVDPNHPLLQNHKLISQKSIFRSFSITGDIRVVYKIEGDATRLYDIGTHNQVY